MPTPSGPSSVAALQQAHENGAHIVLVDPRLNNSIAFADEWVPINPGTDLALILAMSNVLINRDLYDAEYVAANSVGFDEWASAIAGYTPEWAEGITGIPAADIERLALEFAEAAPAASIEPSWRGAFGCSYANSGETARALCLFNTLLGCWNQPGGALFLPSVKAGDLDPAKFPEVPKVEAKMWGAEEYPLALSSMGTNLYVAEMAKEGKVKGLFFYNSNMAAGYSNPAQLAEDFANLDLMVVVDVQMSETAMLADYVLPECSYLERRELPEFVGGRVPVVSLRDQVLEVIHPNTRPGGRDFSRSWPRRAAWGSTSRSPLTSWPTRSCAAWARASMSCARSARSRSPRRPMPTARFPSGRPRRARSSLRARRARRLDCPRARCGSSPR